ncbi:unnamed protein product [Tenebrio molitor]|nr:unnamed protein product [Tenebrio molitor]
MNHTFNEMEPRTVHEVCATLVSICAVIVRMTAGMDFSKTVGWFLWTVVKLRRRSPPDKIECKNF